jgi:transcriptional regulator with XRE-family HTH domain
MATQSEIAKRLGVSQGRISQMVKAGMPTDSVDAATAWRSANVDANRIEAQQRVAPGGADPRIAVARLARQQAQARIAELQADELAGVLGRKEIFLRALRGCAAEIVQQIELIPDRWSQLLVGKTQIEARAILRSEVRELRTAIHVALKRRDPGD